MFSNYWICISGKAQHLSNFEENLDGLEVSLEDLRELRKDAYRMKRQDPVQALNSNQDKMQTISLSSPSLGPCFGDRKIMQRKDCWRALASRREAHEPNYYYGGRLVDESMIVLRKRLHEMKMVERNYEPPSHWMDWEKRYYTSYDSIICEVVGFLQSQLMNTRPTLALGFMALLTLSVPTTIVVLLFQMLELTKLITTAIHLG
ncbi:hypothetical protein RJ641_002802 [Dillenia turbinata]|uniref:Uncharacterized protein n=1 Tax=Dillenia turbinata TaxID=194707 RepID=A0AAN8VG17_9MAGN